MIKEYEILIKGHPRNIKHFLNLNYDIKVGQPIWVNPKHLSKGSPSIITCICENCQKEVKNAFKDYYLYTNGLRDNYYCNSCKYIKFEITSYAKYGVSNPMKNEVVKQTLKQTMLTRYGVDHFSKTEKYKQSFKETSIRKWGVENPFINEEVKNKIKETNLKNLGVYYPMQNNDVSIKSKQTCINNWGKDRFSKTTLFKDKMYRITENRFFKLLEEEYDVINYSNELFEIKHKKCNTIFTTHKGLVYTRYRTDKIICTHCNPLNLKSSSIEIEIRFFLDEYNIEYITNDKKILNGLELDIFIPKYNLALEINGIYWHSELFKDKLYHINKTIKCNEVGVSLIHIWEDDWLYKKDIVKSIILNRLNLIENRIYARNCIISLIELNKAKKFLNENHIQGYSSSSIKIGLLYKNELVSLITFGWRYTNGKKEYELIRFCNKNGYNVIGGTSKLFNYFIKNNEYDKIISFVDISQFIGNLYQTLGFNKVSLSKPNYYWVIDGIRKHPFNYSKKKLVSQGHDINKSETQIMHELGYYRIYSTGQENWIYV